MYISRTNEMYYEIPITWLPYNLDDFLLFAIRMYFENEINMKDKNHFFKFLVLIIILIECYIYMIKLYFYLGAYFISII
jgi:hypothetical protein